MDGRLVKFKPSIQSKTTFASIVIVGVLSSFYFEVWPILLAIWIVMVAPALSVRHTMFAFTLMFRIGLPLAAAILSLVLYQWSHTQTNFAVMAAALVRSWTQANAFFSVGATLYAVCVAFVLWKAMSDWDNLKSLLREEANEIKSILGFLEYFDNIDDAETVESVKAMRNLFGRYVDRVTDFGRPDVDDVNARALRSCVAHVERIATPGENDRIALEQVMQGIANLSKIRARRISALETRLSPYMFLMLAALSLSILVFFFVFDSQEFNASHFIVPSLSFLFVFILVMLRDLDKPFEGYWRIKMETFEEVRALLREGGSHRPELEEAA